MSYNEIGDAEIDQDSPITTTLLAKLRDNLTAVAQRMTGAPRVQVPVVEVFTSGSSVTWDIPDGVTSWEVIATGGGGVAYHSGGGSDSTFTYDGVTVTGGGAANSLTGQPGGGASGGDMNILGGVGDGSSVGGASYWGGGAANSASGPYGAGSGVSAGYPGGPAGGTAIKRFVKVNGVDSATYTVGAGDVGGGRDGVIVIRY